MHISIDTRRVRSLNDKKIGNGPIVYWMSRDQRVDDNWALLYARDLAVEYKQPLVVVFCLAPNFLGAMWRQYDFMLKGLEEVEQRLIELTIPFHVLLGNPQEELIRFSESMHVGAIVADFDPLRIKRQWREEVAKTSSCAFFEVDAHNIVPCWVASSKCEFGAYTLRPKIRNVLEEYLTDFPPIEVTKQKAYTYTKINWTAIRNVVCVDRRAEPVDWIVPGERSAKRALYEFFEKKLALYEEKRNNPNERGQSDLSPYLHFGHISAQRVAWDVRQNSFVIQESKESFLEELIVRRELADNYCYYNTNYDSFDGFWGWAKDSLSSHRGDPREYTYTLEQFEHAQTHDDLWNAAQREMVRTGKMHGYMRMYWAKKILEWTESPEEAITIALYLNDTYELDGRDPNGYTGIAWSIGGVHDRAWFDRPVYGKVRYMNANGCKKKFDTERYIQQNQK